VNVCVCVLYLRKKNWRGGKDSCRFMFLASPPLVANTDDGFLWWSAFECLPADEPWGVVSATRRSPCVAPWACARVNPGGLA